MKKSGAILGLLIISVLLISIISSVSFVRAGLLEDIWNKITGKVTENAITECTTDANCSPIEKEYCGGSNACFDITYYNCVDGKCVASNEGGGCHPCPYGCENGACLEAPPVTKCTDSDGGKDYYAKGTTIGFNSKGEPITESDTCGFTVVQATGELTYNYVNEFYCVGSIVYGTQYNCPNNCKNGVCIRGEEPKPPVPEVPPTEVVRICAAKITINLDKDIYYYGDDFKLEIRVFDSQGNPLSYYPIYSTIYTYADDVWHTPEEDKTSENGYIVQRGRIEKGQQSLGKTKIKVYTPKTSRAGTADCDSVEDSITIEIREGEEKEEPTPKPVPCGIGSCVPEEEAEEVEAIPEEKIFYSCNGCELDDKCYPMGYRKERKYCSENYEFIEQLRVGSCDNNFECESNVCVAGECVGENLIKRIINFFKKMFGIEPEPEEPGLEMCSKLLIKKNIGDYKYIQTEYGKRKEQQAPVYSKDGTYTDTIKCCMAHYINKEKDEEKAALVCPYDNRQDVENSLYWLSIKEEKLDLIEYKKHKVYGDANKVIIWTNNKYLIACGGDPKIGTPLAEDIADAYLKKYPSDLDITRDEIPEVPPQSEPPKECGAIIDIDKRYECYTSLAVKNKDISVCEKITIRDEHYRQTDIYIRDKCYRDVAIETSDANICGEISGDDVDTKDSCYIEVALKTKDNSLCEKTIQKNLCYAVVTNDPSICEKITTSKEKDACYYVIAIETNNISLCEKMNATFGKNECYEKIENCELAGAGERNVCYLNLARRTNDASFCEKIIDSQALKKVTCYVEVAAATNDINLCERVTDILDKDYCYKGVARETNDDRICEKIINSSIKEKCITIAQE